MAKKEKRDGRQAELFRPSKIVPIKTKEERDKPTQSLEEAMENAKRDIYPD